VFPAAVERALYGAPGVHEAAAVDLEGRLVAAVVVGADGAIDVDALLTRLRAALPASSVPSEIRRVDTIPRGATGKVRRDDLCRLLVG
jgi:fatty-acyl-CoA synthase